MYKEREMFKKVGVLLGAFLIFGALMLAGCGSDDNSVNSVDSKTYVHVPFPDGSYFTRVRSISVTATGTGITTPVTVNDTTIVGTTQSDIPLSVASGTARHFDVVASDSLGQNLYRTQFDATVTSGGRTDLSAILMPIGYGNPTKVKLFRDAIPWQAYGASTDSVLLHAGFTEGAGTQQYRILESSLMGSVTLTPGTDLVIIQSNQSATFYENYSNARSEFDAFVEQGGTLLFLSSMQIGVGSEPLLVFPESVLCLAQTDYVNYTKVNDHPISMGYEDTINGSYASYNVYTNLASGSLVIYTDSRDSATTVIYAHGKGTVVINSQTIEFYRGYGGEMETMLSQTIRFLLGLDPTPDPHRRSGHPIGERPATDMN
jgi:hypothetical protein